jgi:imidazolonepropionase-like amidohydrolase
MRGRILSTALLSLSLSILQGQDTIVHSVIMAGNIKGYSKTWQMPDGSWRNTYQFNDRGRGDSTVTDYRVDARGLLTYMDVQGVDYMKSPVQEHFVWKEGVAQWDNASEHEKRAQTSPAWYFGLKGGAGNFAGALLKNGGQLDLLPSGHARIKTLLTKSFPTKSGDKKISLVAIEEVGLTPFYSWLDEKNEDFANVSDWSSTIRRGYENLVPMLLVEQKTFEGNFYTSIAKRQDLHGHNIYVWDVRVFDAKSGKALEHQDVEISNGKILRVGPTRGQVPNLKERIEIDGRGKTLLPGLWDMHTHMSDNSEGIFHIANGVTNVRDMGNGEELLQRIEQIKKGEIIGPEEVVISGFIDGAGPFAAPTGALINNLDEGLEAVRKYAAKGYKQIKLYSSIKPEWVKPMIDEAKKHGMRVCGHIPAYMTAEQAIRAGYDEVTHMNMLVLNFFGDTIDTRSRQRFILPAEKAGTIDLEGKKFKDFVALMKERNIAVDPTLSVFEELFTARDGQISEVFKPVIDQFPVMAQRNIRAGGGGLPITPEKDAAYRNSFKVMERILKKLYEAGITIVPGTDGFAGYTLHRELELYSEAGIPNAEVLRIATLVPAQLTGTSDKYGSVEAGKVANLVLVDGDPLKNISDIRRTAVVIKEGIYYNPAELLAELSIKKK